MIIFRYLCRELLSVTTAVSLVLLMVLISGRFVKYLGNALSGDLDPEVIFAAIGYRIPAFIELALPLAFFLAILLTFGRLYVENEMSVLKACGFSERKLLFFTFILACFLALVVGYLSLYVTPKGIKKAEAIFNIQTQKSELDRVKEKKFYSLRGGKGVIWVDSISEARELENIFISTTSELANTLEGTPVMVIANKGFQTKDIETDDRFLSLEKGYRVEGVPGEHDYQITHFEGFGTRLEPPERLSEYSATDSMSTKTLMNSSEIKHRIALQWRFSIPIMMLIVTLLAFPLSRIDPRSGRYVRILPAILLYFVYLVSLKAIRGAIVSGSIPIGVTLIPVHLGFLILALGLLFANQIAFWSSRILSIIRRGGKNE